MDYIRRYKNLQSLKRQGEGDVKVDRKLVDLELASMVEHEYITKTYNLFRESVDEVMGQLNGKVNNCLTKQEWETLRPFFDSLVVSVAEIARSFYVIVSANVNEEAYNALGFVDHQIFKNRLECAIVFLDN
eukprot:TRINITY_DN10983_c0_g1_i1.p1 TRINITY_DN10983_c0_g1~~TRINITY_DN10983_c0_g1_i1.p1  ORF type:complete len:131 (-),score=26.67 TRINITY_DN10983_c0_g1_i1:112-504(-)